MKKYFKDILTVDVGENTAFAHWQGTSEPDTSIFTSSNYILLLEVFETVLRRYYPLHLKKVYIEDSVMMGRMSIAANERFTDLTKLVGSYQSKCHSLRINCELVSVREWKGQLTDKQVAQWIYEATGQKYNSPHIRSAVGIGLYKMGRF